MTRAAAAAALARLGLAAPPPLGPELTPALAPPADPAPCAPRPPHPRAAHVHVHARGVALRYGCCCWCCCWVAAAVGFTRRSLTRGRARGNFSHKAFFLSLVFFSFAKLTFTPFHFSPVVSIPPGLLVLLLHSSLFSRLVKVLGFCRWFSPLVAAVPKEGKRSSCGRIGKVF